MPLPAIFAGLLIGFLILAAIILIWSALGLIVGFLHYIIRKPAPAPPADEPPPGCDVCDLMQGLWSDMQWWEKAAALLNFTLVNIICQAKGCGSLDLR